MKAGLVVGLTRGSGCYLGVDSFEDSAGPGGDPGAAEDGEPGEGEDGWVVSATSVEREGSAAPGLEVVMGLRRVWADASRQPIEGVQFHPESFMTPEGPRLLANFLAMGPGGRETALAARA